MPLHIPVDPRLHLIFDLLAWAAAAATARLLYGWRLKELAGTATAGLGPGYALSLAAGAIAGAWVAGSANTAMMTIPYPSHSIAGALAGGILGVELYKAARGIRTSTGAIWVGPLAVGIAVGRIGCLLAGIKDDTYGIPTKLPWAVDLGDGIGRHPVQLYESATMVIFLAVYLLALKHRRQWVRCRAFYIFVFVYAAQRFAWEFLKPYPRLLGPLDLFQLLAAFMIAYALTFDARARRSHN